jgi:hypothetical protein
MLKLWDTGLSQGFWTSVSIEFLTKGITAMVMSSKRAAEKFNALSGGSDDVTGVFGPVISGGW